MSFSHEAHDWVETGLAELGRAGIDGVRIEVLAERMGVTKGGFYRRFKDRRALLDAMLKTWADGRAEAIARQTALDGQTPAERLRSIVRPFERLNPQSIATELAVRQWARKDPTAARAAASVDAARMKAVRSLFRGVGWPAREAEARAMIFYAFLFGESLLFLEQSARKRAAMLAACAEALARAP